MKAILILSFLSVFSSVVHSEDCHVSVRAHCKQPGGGRTFALFVQGQVSEDRCGNPNDAEGQEATHIAIKSWFEDYIGQNEFCAVDEDNAIALNFLYFDSYDDALSNKQQNYNYCYQDNYKYRCQMMNNFIEF